MRKDLTEIVCIIDRSGSMQSIASDAIGGYNAFLDDQKRFPGQARFTLILFDHEYQVAVNSTDIRHANHLNKDTYIPRGSTALLDAIGKTIDDMGARLRDTSEYERPNKVIIAILTDGQENASKKYSLVNISEMIKHQQEKYSWEFIFLAANQDAFQAASTMSINLKNTFNFAATGVGIRSAYRSMSDTVGSYRRATPQQQEEKLWVPRSQS